jgi:hypothetical protein
MLVQPSALSWLAMAGADRAAPLEFLPRAFQPDDWVAVLLKHHETGRTLQRVGPLSMTMHPRCQAWLRAMNAQRFSIYVSVNAITPGRRARTRDAIGAIRHVFLDADRDGPAVLRHVAARRDLPAPSYVLHSSPNRVHVFWRVRGFELAQAEALQKMLARQIGTDTAATPASQMTRLPGFFSHKYETPHLVTVSYYDAQRVLTPAAFPRSFHADTPPSSEPATRQRPFDRDLPVIERARCFLARVPPAIAGAHGDVHTFQVCCRLVRGFALDQQEALTVLRDWNARCQPPWREVELREKLRHALRYGREPVGGLL